MMIMILDQGNPGVLRLVTTEILSINNKTTT